MPCVILPLQHPELSGSWFELSLSHWPLPNICLTNFMWKGYYGIKGEGQEADIDFLGFFQSIDTEIDTEIFLLSPLSQYLQIIADAWNNFFNLLSQHTEGSERSALICTVLK